MYDIKSLYEATSVQNAVELLSAHPEAVIIAGGSDVLIKMREGKLAGCELVSIYKLDELRGIHLTEDGSIKILPLTSFSHITRNPIIKELIPVLGEAVDQVGGPQIRNIGTIGGNVANGVTSADSASTLFALDAEIEITGKDGIRTVHIAEFYKGPGKVDLNVSELITAIYIRRGSYENTFGHYIKYAMRNAMDIATTGCSVNVRLSPDKKTIERLRVAFGVAGPVPMRCSLAEKAASGQDVAKSTITDVARVALMEVKPRTSWRASKELRLQLIEELTMRAAKTAIELAGGEI